MKSLNVAEIAMYGREPRFLPDCDVISDTELARAYTWYTYACDNEDSQKFTLAYMREAEYEKEEIQKVSSLHPNKFNAVGWLSRLKVNGANLSERSEDALVLWIEELIELADKQQAVADAAPVEIKSEYVPSVYEKTRDTSSAYIAHLEDVIDRKDWSFNPYNWMLANDIKGIHANRILEKYENLLDELIQVSECKKGSDLAEAYGFFKKSEFIAYFELIQKIVADADRLALNLKAARKPRAKKKPSVSKVLAKVSYKPRDDEYKISSVDPYKIIGASQVWLFNTKTRVLSVINVAEKETLNIKGTTIQGFDEKRSISKKVRKPEIVLEKVLNSGKVPLRTLMDSINSTVYEATGRLNKDTVIVKVVN